MTLSTRTQEFAQRWLTPPVRRLFEAEIANERHGGVAPATLSSTIDSLSQGGAEVFELGADDVVALAVIRDLLPGETPVSLLTDGSVQLPQREHLYTKCGDCHLFVEENTAAYDDEGNRINGVAPYVHLHRGDDADEALDETHEALPSGKRHTLAWWRENGPNAMKARFIVADREKEDEARHAAHPQHTECADGCGLDINHQGACLDKPGGRQVCDHSEEN